MASDWLVIFVNIKLGIKFRYEAYPAALISI